MIGPPTDEGAPIETLGALHRGGRRRARRDESGNRRNGGRNPERRSHRAPSGQAPQQRVDCDCDPSALVSTMVFGSLR